jgi:hypothetical protein
MFQVKRSQKFVLGPPAESCKLDPKNDRYTKSINQNEIHPKNSMFNILKVKSNQNSPQEPQQQ